MALLVGLVPIGIDVVLRSADGVQQILIFLRKPKVGGSEIVGELCLVARADENGGDRRPSCHPGPSR